MFSIIIPTYNKAEYLRLTLASFVHQSCRDFELVIVNDGSTDATRQVIDAYADKLAIKVVEHDNSGRSAARNKGIEAAAGPYLIFCDDDTIARPDFVQQYAEAFRQHGDNCWFRGEIERALTYWKKDSLPLTAANLASLRQLLGEQWEQIASCSEYALVSEDDIVHRFDSAIARVHFGNELAEKNNPPWFDMRQMGDFHFCCMFSTTANMAVSKRLMTEIGGFDTQFKGWGMEDTDLCYRLWRHGAQFVPYMTAVNYHQAHPTKKNAANTTGNDRADEFADNLAYFGSKYNELEAYVFHKIVKYRLDVFAADRFIKKTRPPGGKPGPAPKTGYAYRVVAHLFVLAGLRLTLQYAVIPAVNFVLRLGSKRANSEPR